MTSACTSSQEVSQLKKISHEDIHRVVLEQCDPHMRRKKHYEWMTDEAKLFILFTNYRPRRGSRPAVGLRLTRYGEGLMCKVFNHWRFESEQVITGRVALSLDKNMMWPYYVDQKTVTLFNREDAAWFKLSGDITGFVEDL